MVSNNQKEHVEHHQEDDENQFAEDENFNDADQMDPDLFNEINITIK